jgi:hypothetical protein
MVILYIYSTCWSMKSTFYERQHLVDEPVLEVVLSNEVRLISWADKVIGMWDHLV